ncbi:MAG: DUF1343 domain-containing protein [Bacteroidetes bacterium]|nr:DUF1343 domain-containing protein [Bacteroidota bacterium]
MNALFFRLLFFAILVGSVTINAQTPLGEKNRITPGAYQMNEYLPILKNRKVGYVGNQASMVGQRNTLDTLVSRGVKIVKIFSAEHGFRGDAADGKLIRNTIDKQTGIPIVSLYADYKKPCKEDLQGINVIVFDLQDVGCRFYTYISTLSYLMKSCAENQVGIIILDRPNPNGYYIDGPVLQSRYSSFVGLYQIPVVYGMTIGEYATMINEEHWLGENLKCGLRVIQCKNYSHANRYQLPVPPSPNLKSMASVYLYPTLCFFEGTIVSVGRGTDHPFEVIGHPDYLDGDYTFTPESIQGVSDNPPLLGQVCHGLNLLNKADIMKQNGQIDLTLIIKVYNELKSKGKFFTPYFDKLAGTDQLRIQIEKGMSENEIRQSWKEDLAKFMKIRNKYLLYPDNQ